MTPDKDQSIAKLLQESKDMIQRFEALTSKDSVIRAKTDDPENLEDLDGGLEPASDAFFDLFVEEDAMTVVAEFRPPAGEGKPLNLDRIQEGLDAKGVLVGVRWDELHQAIDDCNLERKVRSKVIIAQGVDPTPEVPEHLRLKEPTDKPQANNPIQSDVDFKEITPFVMVNQGDVLAERVPRVPGVPGTDVLGRPVPFPTESPRVWTPGENVTETPLGFEAAISGRLVLEASAFSVSPILELKEGVDYRTGHIRFQGEVVVLGPVAVGFSLEAGRSLTSRDVLDATTVKTGGDLRAPGGVIGHGVGRLDVGGAVSTKFLEHCYLLAEGNVTIATGAFNSVIKTRGKVLFGERGILAGGQVHSLDGADVFQIGTATGPRTELVVGLDFRGMERILWLRNRSQELHGQLKKIDAAVPYAGTRVPELLAASKKLRIEILELTESARKQLMNLGENDQASVVVRGTVFPGTQIEICHIPFLVNQKLSAVKFALDKRKGIVTVEPLAGPPPKTTTPSAPAPKKH